MKFIGMGVVIKADKDWRGVGRPQIAIHSQLPHFLVVFFTICYICLSSSLQTLFYFVLCY